MVRSSSSPSTALQWPTVHESPTSQALCFRTPVVCWTARRRRVGLPASPIDRVYVLRTCAHPSPSSRRGRDGGSSVKAEEYQELKALFLALRDVGASERTRLIEQHCGGDAEKRRELERLLEAHARAGESNRPGTWTLCPDLQGGTRDADAGPQTRELAENGAGCDWLRRRLAPAAAAPAVNPPRRMVRSSPTRGSRLSSFTPGEHDDRVVTASAGRTGARGTIPPGSAFSALRVTGL